MPADNILRAYAVLGLPPGASARDVRRRYKELVRTWHPDRFSADPAGQADAERHLREINLAYHAVLDARSAPARSSYAESATGGEAAPPHSPVTPGARLTREQIDALVASIGTQGPVDTLLEGLGRVGEAGRVGCIGLGAILVVAGVLSRALPSIHMDTVDLALGALLLASGFALRWLRRREPPA